jgi:hypothetical protein
MLSLVPVQLQRTWPLLIYLRGNLSQRSLVDVVKKGDLVEDSEFMETLLVAVPKCVTAITIRRFPAIQLGCLSCMDRSSRHADELQKPAEGLGEQVRAIDGHGRPAEYTVGWTTSSLLFLFDVPP